MEIFAVGHMELDIEAPTRHHMGLFKPCHVLVSQEATLPCLGEKAAPAPVLGHRKEIQQLPAVQGQEKLTAPLWLPCPHLSARSILPEWLKQEGSMLTPGLRLKHISSFLTFITMADIKFEHP